MTEESWHARARAMAAKTGTRDPEIRRALESVPRHRFVPERFQESAYEDEPLPLPSGEATISAPHMVALQLEAARLAPGQAVLEVGSGSGYLLALLFEVLHGSGRILGLEIEPRLAETARATLGSLGYPASVEVRCSDGWLGAPDRAPFDRILVSCAVPEIPEAWRAQLATDGRLVAPVGGAWVQHLLTFGSGPDPIETGPACRFVAVRRPRDPIYRA